MNAPTEARISVQRRRAAAVGSGISRGVAFPSPGLELGDVFEHDVT
jgi:hypothetical protein